MDYTYLVYNEERQVVKGKISAFGEEAAVDMLAKLGYRVISLKPVTTFLPSAGSLFREKVKQSEIIVFSRQLALLTESGVGIIQSLELLQEQMTSKELKRVLTEVVSDLRGGGSLASALSKHPHIFPPVYHRMVGVGEQTGGIESVLRDLADFFERQSSTVNKLKSALTYPIIVLCLAIVVAALLVVVVLPPIVSMFESLGGELPLPTRMLLGFVDFATNYGLLVLLILAGMGIAGYIYSRTPAGRYLKDKIVLRLPLLGRVSLLSELSRCCRSLSLLFKSGLPLPDVMDLTAQASGNRVMKRALEDVGRDMLRGEGLTKPMRKRSVFLPLMVEMTKVGEETGNLDEVLQTVAYTYEVDADNRIQTMLAMIEPAMTVIMGLGVAFLALSIFLPLYSSLSLVG